MEYKQRIQLLETLAEIQNGHCAPIELSIGYVSDDNYVMDGIMIKSAPPKVVEKLVTMGYGLDITSKGVLVYKY